MKKSVLAVLAIVCSAINFVACGSSKSTAPKASGLPERVLAAQSVTTSSVFGGLVILNGDNDTIPRVAPLDAGNDFGLMAVSPSRNIAASFDIGANAIFAVDTTKETSIGSVKLLGPTNSFVVPTASPIGFAAVPSGAVTGYSFTGAVQELNFSSGASLTIAVNNAQTVVSNGTGTQLLVFSGDSNSVTVLNPLNAAPPVDTSCYGTLPNAVCTVVPGFDRPVFAIINNNTAYVLNCGPQCGGTQASVMLFDLPSLTITQTIPVDAATMGLLNNSILYVAGTSPTNNACTGQKTAATTCGRLDIIDLSAGKVVNTAVITDGYHTRMDYTVNNQLFIGSKDCTNIGNVNNPIGEVRGCLSILKADGSVFFPPDNGNVDGLQGFTTRDIEYVAEGGELRVYDTTKDILLINDFLPEGTINVVGYVGDIRAIDFF